ncbi:MAG: dinitrogenase iron-molybdenum cofactor [Propionibacteriaceae bacterium]|nr:dinitrogenase iron-molybdenum cofactor [Propionibacteriaceae bacterium]
MIIAVNIVGSLVGEGLGRAQTMAVADVEDGTILSWKEIEVRWDLSHDQPSAGEQAAPDAPFHTAHTSHGSHHARIVTFMRDHDVEVVVTGHVGPPMAHTLGLMGITVLVGATGEAKQVAVEAAAFVNK